LVWGKHDKGTNQLCNTSTKKFAVLKKTANGHDPKPLPSIVTSHNIHYVSKVRFTDTLPSYSRSFKSLLSKG